MGLLVLFGCVGNLEQEEGARNDVGFPCHKNRKCGNVGKVSSIVVVCANSGKDGSVGGLT